jgi:hypothetical protein
MKKQPRVAGKSDGSGVIFDKNVEAGLRIEKLLAAVTSNNLHPEWNAGISVGREFRWDEVD